MGLGERWTMGHGISVLRVFYARLSYPREVRHHPGNAGRDRSDQFHHADRDGRTGPDPDRLFPSCHRSDRGTHRRGILAPSSKDPEAPDRGRGASAENGLTAQIAPIVVSAVKRTANREGSVLARDASRVSLPIIGFTQLSKTEATRPADCRPSRRRRVTQPCPTLFPSRPTSGRETEPPL